MNPIGRTLPNSEEAEEQLISCCMIDEGATMARALVAGVTPESFYVTANMIAFAGLSRLCEAGKSTSVTLLVDVLRESKELDSVGGYSRIVQVSCLAPTTAYAGHFIDRVLELATLRRLIRSAAQISEDCYGWSGGDIGEFVGQASSSILGSSSHTPVASWSEALQAVQRKIDVMTDPGADPHTGELSFGLSDLDRQFQPMQGGQLVVLAARPSVGKSSLARMIAYKAAQSGKEVIFASLEVMAPSLATNLAQTVTGIPFRALRRAHPEDVATFRKAVGSLALPNLHVIAASQVRIAALRAHAKLLRARGRPAGLIVVDYLQLLPDSEPGKGENRATSVGRCSRALKQLAIEEDCPVMALSQLNRDSAKDGREPALHDLRESGDIEQDADKVILLHRPPKNPLTGAEQAEASLPSDVPSFFINAIQAKGRDDGTAIVSLNFRRAITRFEQIARTAQ